jgi:heme exporter protein CcmD
MQELVGRYGAYVIPAWGISAAVLLWMVVDSLWRARRWRQAADARNSDDAAD